AAAPRSAQRGIKARTESPFPGRGALAIVRVSRRSPDRIPGVPRLRLPAAGRSPFRSQELFDGRARLTKQSVKATPISPAIKRLPSLLETSRVGPTLPPIAPLELPWQTPAASVQNNVPALPVPGAIVSKPLPPPLPVMHLTGVIRGEPLLAIIEGEKEHYIVQPGDTVAGGYKVASITLQEVVLRTGDRRVLVLRLGGKRG
ncbi:MAG TPA: hypothetical protein VHR86_06380, partial [Armatimonadota bacterium]|nr:hypothetical protein [Armatimonadota bacterium]